MKCKFIELTGTDDSKILINTIHIGWIEPIKDGSSITCNMVHYSFSKKVKESYDAIKLMIAAD